MKEVEGVSGGGAKTEPVTYFIVGEFTVHAILAGGDGAYTRICVVEGVLAYTIGEAFLQRIMGSLEAWYHRAGQ